MFNDKIFLVTGGTGSFGNQVVSRLLQEGVKEIRILSRDEKKQSDMRKLYRESKLKFYLGDVRDRLSLTQPMRGADFVFHAAALKQVPSCEFYPMEAIKTNVHGAFNVIRSAQTHGVEKVVVLSTDKAVYPINAMGMSKALMEKVMIAESRNARSSTFKVMGTRYGNVVASRGSVIPLFIDQIKNNQALTITDPEMTRFMMSLDSAVDLVFHAFQEGERGDIFVKKAPSATIETIALAIQKLLKTQNSSIKIIGTRHGEKKHETLINREELSVAQQLTDYFRIPSDNRDLESTHKHFVNTGNVDVSGGLDYTSANTYQLNVDETCDFLENIPQVRSLLKC